ncbi:hypothetical protein ACHAXA_007253 [Cyclostephanos tholiformis]|uniref:J domain-containing protein n=1 Tax=Cyclostephanos tholiformis TaxID=382380 RepID=A0ABD3SGJ0_9STRA
MHLQRHFLRIVVEEEEEEEEEECDHHDYVDAYDGRGSRVEKEEEDGVYQFDEYDVDHASQYRSSSWQQSSSSSEYDDYYHYAEEGSWSSPSMTYYNNDDGANDSYQIAYDDITYIDEDSSARRISSPDPLANEREGPWMISPEEDDVFVEEERGEGTTEALRWGRHEVERRDAERIAAAREEAAWAYRMAESREGKVRIPLSVDARAWEEDASASSDVIVTSPFTSNGANDDDLEGELARKRAEYYRRQIEMRNNGKSSSSIAKSRWIPKLPNTNDPLELLGLDRRNPPEDVNDIRRAFLKMAKKYHPDAVAADASPEQREKASVNFARINAAYQLLKDGRGKGRYDDYFATTLGGPMYEPRNGSSRGGRRSSFYRGYDDEDYGSSIFSGQTYSARYGPVRGRHQQHQPFRSQGGRHRDHNYGESRKNPFGRRNRQEVGDNCHVSGKEFPPFFNN